MGVTRSVLTALAAGCLMASPTRAQSGARDARNSCRTILSDVIAGATEIGAPAITGELAASIRRIVDSTVPRSAIEWAPPDPFHELRPSAPAFVPQDTLATRLEALIRQRDDTMEARNQVATVLAEILRGLTEPTQFQTSVVELAYDQMRLPPGPAEVVARDLRLSVERRAAALNALAHVTADSALVSVLFINLCQLGTWAGAMPISDSVRGEMPAAISEGGETLLRNVLSWLVVDTEAIRRLAPCKSFEGCFPNSPQLLAWLRRNYGDLDY